MNETDATRRLDAVAEGYRAMAEINLALAEEQFHLEHELQTFVPDSSSGGW